MSPKLPTEKHLQDLKEDKFGRLSISEKLLDNVLLNMELPNCFGLYGNWGSGKSTMLHFIMEHLKARKDKDIKVVYFEPWKYEYAQEGNLLFALLKEIKTAFGFADEPAWKKVGKIALTAGAWSLKTLTLSSVDTMEIKGTADAVEDLLLAKHEKWVDETSEFKKAFDALVANGLKKAKAKRLFIFVDDLDRCLPENAVKLLEAMKNFLSIDSVLFVLAIDRRVMTEMIEKKYGLHEGYGDEYLMKIIHYSYEIPRPSFREIVEEIFEAYGLESVGEREKNYIANFLHEFAGETRKAKHYLQNFCMKTCLQDTTLASIEGEKFALHFPALFVASFLSNRFPHLFTNVELRDRLINLRNGADKNSRGEDGQYANIIAKDSSISMSDRKLIEAMLKHKITLPNQSNPPELIDIELLSAGFRLWQS